MVGGPLFLVSECGESTKGSTESTFHRSQTQLPYREECLMWKVGLYGDNSQGGRKIGTLVKGTVSLK